MRGVRAKRLRKLAREYEPQKFKHGERPYYWNPHSQSIIVGGFRAVYQTFKRYYKKFRREDYVSKFMDSKNKA